MWEDPLSLLWENDILARNLGLQFCPPANGMDLPQCYGTDFLQNGPVCKTVYRKRGEALGTRLREKCTIISSLGTREEKIRRGRKVSTKIKCQAELLVKLKNQRRDNFLITRLRRILLIVAISSSRSYHHYITIINTITS